MIISLMNGNKTKLIESIMKKKLSNEKEVRQGLGKKKGN